jgi:hypothetical protein
MKTKTITTTMPINEYNEMVELKERFGLSVNKFIKKGLEYYKGLKELDEELKENWTYKNESK